MTSILLLGFLLGMRHAIEADHVAAVASLTSRAGSLWNGIRQGAVWGLGHSLALFLFGGVVLFFADIVPGTMVLWLEFAVGVMLIFLGIDVIGRLVRERIHFHSHSHGGHETHFHAHSHQSEPGDKHDPARHRHSHSAGFPIRAFLVGLMHGMAGSAALILLTLKTISSPWLGLAYIALFGFGSIAGMGLFSIVVAIPLRAARHLTWVYNGLQAAIGLSTIALGVFTLAEFSAS